MTYRELWLSNFDDTDCPHLFTLYWKCQNETLFMNVREMWNGTQLNWFMLLHGPSVFCKKFQKICTVINNSFKTFIIDLHKTGGICSCSASHTKMYIAILLSVNYSLVHPSIFCFGISESCLQTSGSTPWMADQPVTKHLPTQYSTNTEKTHTHIHALSGVQNHDPSVWAV